MAIDYTHAPTADLVTEIQRLADELSRRHPPFDLAPQEPAKKQARTADDWLDYLMDDAIRSKLVEKYERLEFVSRSMVEFFIIENDDFLPGDKIPESHGKRGDGSARMEPRWRRQLIVALRKGQDVPGFPLQRVKSTKGDFKLI
jgi:hypothetical protein